MHGRHGVRCRKKLFADSTPVSGRKLVLYKVLSRFKCKMRGGNISPGYARNGASPGFRSSSQVLARSRVTCCPPPEIAVNPPYGLQTLTLGPTPILTPNPTPTQLPGKPAPPSTPMGLPMLIHPFARTARDDFAFFASVHPNYWQTIWELSRNTHLSRQLPAFDRLVIQGGFRCTFTT